MEGVDLGEGELGREKKRREEEVDGETVWGVLYVRIIYFQLKKEREK